MRGQQWVPPDAAYEQGAIRRVIDDAIGHAQST